MRNPQPKRRVILILVLLTTLAAVPGWNLGRRALGAVLFNSPFKRSDVLPYIAGKPFVLTIEHPDFKGDSRIRYAMIKDRTGTIILGYWLPYTTKGQVVIFDPTATIKYRIAVAFDTRNLLQVEPTPTERSMPGMSPPPKTLPAPMGPIGSGSILCLVTSVGTVDCPPLLLDPVDLVP